MAEQISSCKKQLLNISTSVCLIHALMLEFKTPQSHAKCQNSLDHQSTLMKDQLGTLLRGFYLVFIIPHCNVHWIQDSLTIFIHMISKTFKLTINRETLPELMINIKLIEKRELVRQSRSVPCEKSIWKFGQL